MTDKNSFKIHSNIMAPKTSLILKFTLALLIIVIIAIIGFLVIKINQISNLQSLVSSLQDQINSSQEQNLELQRQINERNQPEPTNQPQNEPTANETKAFENQYLKITLNQGWEIKEIGDSVNITKNNYILYIDPNTTQASGVEGGRFSEIAQGAPGVDLVITIHPSEPCGTSEEKNISNKLTRLDYYISSADASETCNAPSSADKLWYFSYITTKNNGYFGDPTKLNSSITPPRQFVITLSYKTDNINNLPKNNSTELIRALNEMAEIVNSIVLK